MAVKDLLHRHHSSLLTQSSPVLNITLLLITKGFTISSVLYESPVTRVNCEGNCYADGDYSTERQIDTSAARDRTIARLLERELRTSAWCQVRAGGLPYGLQSVTNAAVLPPSFPPSPCLTKLRRHSLQHRALGRRTK
jgi:hypothetical protein